MLLTLRTTHVPATRLAARFGYAVRFLPVGDEDSLVGPATQMAVFEKEQADD